MGRSARAQRAACTLCILIACALAPVGFATVWRLPGAAFDSPLRALFLAARSHPATTPSPSGSSRAAAPTVSSPPTVRISPAHVETSRWLVAMPEHGAPLLLAAPSPRMREGRDRDDARKLPTPAVTMLHGMCSDPRATCELLRTSAVRSGWLACPTGNATCGQAADWAGSGEQKASFLDQSLAELDRLRDRKPGDPVRDVLIGFSRGAFVARDVAYARPGRWIGLILIGAALVPDAERLRRSGIRRVLLASGDFDGARPTMQRAAAVLTLGGVPARFVGLGPIYHALPHDLDERLGPWLAWIREAERAT